MLPDTLRAGMRWTDEVSEGRVGGRGHGLQPCTARVCRGERDRRQGCRGAGGAWWQGCHKAATQTPGGAGRRAPTSAPDRTCQSWMRPKWALELPAFLCQLLPSLHPNPRSLSSVPPRFARLVRPSFSRVRLTRTRFCVERACQRNCYLAAKARACCARPLRVYTSVSGLLSVRALHYFPHTRMIPRAPRGWENDPIWGVHALA
jgi:hypothetical protein